MSLSLFSSLWLWSQPFSLHLCNQKILTEAHCCLLSGTFPGTLAQVPSHTPAPSSLCGECCPRQSTAPYAVKRGPGGSPPHSGLQMPLDLSTFLLYIPLQFPLITLYHSVWALIGVCVCFSSKDSGFFEDRLCM